MNKFQRILYLFCSLTFLFTMATVLAGCDACASCECQHGCDKFSFDPFSALFSPNRRLQGSGLIVREARDLSEFSIVELSEKGDLFIEIGEENKLIVEAEDNFQEHLVAEIVNGTLNIHKMPEQVTLVTDLPIRYFLTATSLEGLIVKNSGDVVVGEVIADRFSVKISGSGDVHLAGLYAADLEVSLTSSGDLTIDQGVVANQQIALTSSGEYDGRQVISQQSSARLSSSGSASLHVSEQLEADLSSSGNIYYRGQPEIQTRDASSTGRVLKTP